MPNKKKQRITAFINPSIVTQAKAQAIVEGSTMTNLIEKALLSYLPKQTTIEKINTQ